MKAILTLAVMFELCCLPVFGGESHESGPFNPEKRQVKEDIVSATQVRSVDAPAGEALSEDYQLTVDGRKVSVYSCRVSAVPFNQVWPGYQRPLDQTELAAFACWDMSGPVAVEVRCRRTPKSVIIRPASFGIVPKLDGDRIAFTLDRPRSVVVEVDGPHHALHLFASSLEKDIPAPDAPGVRYFGPGIHRPGRIELKSGETVYLAAGAVVYGSIHGRSVSKIRITGRGIIDVSPFERGEGGGAIQLTDCSDAIIEGIVMRNPDVWCCSLFGCRNVTISDVKLVGLWRYNADGIDVCNSENVIVKDCFVRSFDDALVIKGLKFGRNSFDDRPVRDVRFSRCVVWCDWGRAMEIGAETCAPEIAGIVFEDCDIVRTTHIAMDIQHGDRATVRDIHFENIRVEVDDWNPPPRMQQAKDEKYPEKPGDTYCPALFEIVIRKTPYSKDENCGSVRDVFFKDITVTSRLEPRSSFRGLDAEHTVEGVTIQNLRFNGRPVSNAQEAHLDIGPHVKEVRFSGAAVATPGK